MLLLQIYQRNDIFTEILYKNRRIARGYLVDNVLQVGTVAAFEQGLGYLPQLLRVDESHAVGHLLDAADFQALPFFNDLHEVSRLHE